VAATLLAIILLKDKVLKRPNPAVPTKVLAALKPSAVTRVQVRPKTELEIRAERTNGTWVLTEPLQYPAQTASVDALLTALEKLSPAVYITSQERKHRPKADEEDGFKPPQATIIIEQGGEMVQLWVGNPTAPGDQVFLQVIGIEGVYVVDAALLKLIPASANEWRDTTFANLHESAFDRIAVTNGARTIELRRDESSRLWHMTAPIPARADHVRVEELIQKIRTLRVNRFVVDDPKVDLESLGLQPPELQIAFGFGTNRATLFAFGKSPTNDASQVYARRSDHEGVVTVAKDALGPWHVSSINDFRDPHLLTLTCPLKVIEVRGSEHFSLERQTNGSWRVMPGQIPADAGFVDELLTSLSSMQVVEFTKDVATSPVLPAFGLVEPRRTYVLWREATNNVGVATNSIYAELNFGTNQENKVYVRRTDEASVFAVSLADYEHLPSRAVQFRERQIWKLSEDEVTGITIRQQGQSRRLLRKGAHDWALAPGSQGIINPLAIEETVKMITHLEAHRWIGTGQEARSRCGFGAADYELTLELGSGDTRVLELGSALADKPVYACVKLGGEEWVFEFPGSIFAYVSTYLTASNRPQ